MIPFLKDYLTSENTLKRPIKILNRITLGALIGGSAFFSTTVFAQKKPLDHSVYDNWQRFGYNEISPDGKWAVYNVNPQEGDKWLYIQSTSKKTPVEKIHRGEKLSITADSKHVVFAIKPFYKDIKAERVAKRRKSKEKIELAKDSLGIYDLSKNKLVKIPQVLSFSLPKENGNYLAYIQETVIEADSIKKTKKETFNTLYINNLSSGAQAKFDHVDKFSFSEDGAHLVYSIKNPEKPKSDKKGKEEKEENGESEDKKEETTPEVETETLPEGVYLVNTTSFEATPLVSTEGTFKDFRFSKDNNLLAFFATHDEKKKEIKDYQLYLYDISKQSLQTLDNTLSGIPTDWVLAENSAPRFSKNSKNLFLGVAPKKEEKDTTFIEEDHAVLDIWHYKDEYLQTQQLVRLKRDLDKSYLSIVALDNPSKLLVLEEETMSYVSLINEGDADFVLAASDHGNRIEKQWDTDGVNSYFLISTKTGEKKEILENLSGRVQVSPEGKNIVFYESKAQEWYVYDVNSGNIKPLSAGMQVSFADERHDQPSDARAYGVIGWTEGENKVWINDRYDIWEFDLVGNEAPKNLTQNYGRNNKIGFSYLKLDAEAKHIAIEQPLTLVAFQEETKQSGFYQLDVKNNKAPKRILMEPMSGHRTLRKAKDADSYLYIQESFVIPPSLVSTKNLKSTLLLHKTNPQQANYNWGTVELIHYTSQNGKPATGLLYKPEDFDAKKKYPMISYFYERNSDGLHGYEAPAPTPSRLNITYFVSNGYLIFVPDIEYTEGYPGRSAEEYVDAGVDYLKTFDFVNPDKIGIQGQSWGGYQVAHLITRSDRYAAAWSGAPVVNMTSAYGGIRWTSGMNRQFQYEKTQSRIGQTLWDALDLYLENSPLFYMDKVNTPVVIMHNDNDGSVPWYQGIEMYTALRRLSKPVWLLNYNGDEHNLMKRENRKDIQIREQQFFDHYLKDAKAPEWMVKGIPAVQKGKTWGFDLTDEKP